MCLKRRGRPVLQASSAAAGLRLDDAVSWGRGLIMPDPGTSYGRLAYLRFGGDQPSRRRFLAIQKGTQCPYAAGSRLWGCPDWDSASSLASNLDRMLDDFGLFLNLAHEHALDGYILELPEPGYGETLEQLASTTRRILSHLSDRDPAGEHCMDGDVEDPSWAFSFGGERIFINAFARFYLVSHSRYGFACDRTYILFQPRHSFRKAFREGESALADDLRARIRKSYSDYGRPYSAAISASPCDAHRFVRPVDLSGRPVRWWIAEGDYAAREASQAGCAP